VIRGEQSRLGFAADSVIVGRVGTSLRPAPLFDAVPAMRMSKTNFVRAPMRAAAVLLSLLTAAAILGGWPAAAVTIGASGRPRRTTCGCRSAEPLDCRREQTQIARAIQGTGIS
jgi:hypothetical protein